MEKKDVSISAIVPTIGRERVINCVKSIMSQSYPVIEIILCYDGDDLEGFKEFLRKNDIYNFVKILNSGPFNGGNNARQLGVDMSKGEYIALLDDDDEWLPNHLETMINKIENINYPYNFAFSKPIRCRQGEEHRQYVYYDNSDLLSYICIYKKTMRSFGVIQSSLILVGREIFNKVPLNTSLKFHQDTEWFIRLGQELKSELKIYFSDKYTVRTNETLGSVSKKIPSFRSMQLFINTIQDKKYLGNYLLGISYNYAVVQEGFFNKLSIFHYALKNTKPDIRLIGLAFIKLILPWKTLRKIFRK